MSLRTGTRVDGRVAAHLRDRLAEVSAITVDAHGPAERLAEAAQEALAWTRSLLAGPLVFVAGTRTASTAHALLDSEGVPVIVGFALSAVEQSRVVALGSVRAEVALCEGRVDARVDTEEGALLLAPLWSEPPPEAFTDDGLAADAALVREILGDLLLHRCE